MPLQGLGMSCGAAVAVSGTCPGDPITPVAFADSSNTPALACNMPPSPPSTTPAPPSPPVPPPSPDTSCVAGIVLESQGSIPRGWTNKTCADFGTLAAQLFLPTSDPTHLPGGLPDPTSYVVVKPFECVNVDDT
jgi:hypothetical protein